jgi:SAM-dependent methyltransferase
VRNEAAAEENPGRKQRGKSQELHPPSTEAALARLASPKLDDRERCAVSIVRIDAVRGIGRGQIPEAVLVGGLWSYAAGVLYPARMLKRAGVRLVGGPAGDPPVQVPRAGLGRYFSEPDSAPVLLTEPNPNAGLVGDFDRLAVFYEPLVRPFSKPIFDEALDVMRGYLAHDSRVLDVGCGPGHELRSVAKLVPRGEVVGVDLAGGMVEAAHAGARSRGVENCAFFQADAGELPDEFTGRFDLVYSCLAHHHFPDPDAAAASAMRCLRPGGVYCIVDPGPAWFNRVSAPLCRVGDPGWIGWKTPDEFRSLLGGAGFARTCWIPLLPGFGLAVGQAA